MRTLVLVAALAACSKSKEDAAPAPAPTAAAASAPADSVARDTYRARVVDQELGDVAFFLSIPAPPAAADAMVIDGARRVRLPARWDGDKLTIGLDMFDARLTATRDPTTRALVGEWEPSSFFSGRTTRPFRAELRELAPAARVDLGGAAPVDLGEAKTYWRARFSDSGDARIALEQPEPGVLHMTATLRSGNVVYLAGNARGDALRLTGFDGFSLYLVSGTFSPDRKTLTAAWSVGPNLDWRESITATRSEPFELEIAFKAEPGAPATFLPQREKYAGKPVLVTLSATWCSSCFNANPVLRELQADHAKEGLEIVTLLYEMTGDEAVDRERAEAYRREHLVTWDVVPVTGTLARADEIIPEALEEVDLSAFPLAIFVGRDGTIRSAEAGFPGPESREEYAAKVAAYRTAVAALLAGR